MKGRSELFTNFFTDRKPKEEEQGTSYTAEQHVQPDLSDSPAKLQKVSEKDKGETEKIFDTEKNKFGLTSDIREAGYILPDGKMLEL